MKREEIKVPLPSGGTAWIAAVIDHEQANALRRHSMRIARYLDEHNNWLPGLTNEQLDAKDDLVLQFPALHVRTLVLRWQGVKDVNGLALDFPDGLDRVQQPDFDALFQAATVLREKDAEGNWIPRLESS